MKYSLEVTSDYIVNIYKDGLLVYSRGPYANAEEPLDWGSICVQELNDGTFLLETLLDKNEENENPV